MKWLRSFGPRPAMVSASEIHDWAVCAVRFEMEHVEHRRPTNPGALRRRRDAGTARDESHHDSLRQADLLSKVATGTLYAGGALLALTVLLGLASCSAETLEQVSGHVGGLGALLIIGSFVLLRLAGLSRERAAVPAGIRVLASDMGTNRTATLRDERAGLLARPDYVFRRRSGVGFRSVAAELKPRPAPRRPYLPHVLQTAVGIWVLAATKGRKASRTGYLIYQDRREEVTLDSTMRAEVEHAATEVRRIKLGASATRNHLSRSRCERCPFADQCTQSLA